MNEKSELTYQCYVGVQIQETKRSLQQDAYISNFTGERTYGLTYVVPVYSSHGSNVFKVASMTVQLLQIYHHCFNSFIFSLMQTTLILIDRYWWYQLVIIIKSANLI